MKLRHRLLPLPVLARLANLAEWLHRELEAEWAFRALSGRYRQRGDVPRPADSVRLAARLEQLRAEIEHAEDEYRGRMDALAEHAEETESMLRTAREIEQL